MDRKEIKLCGSDEQSIQGSDGEGTASHTENSSQTQEPLPICLSLTVLLRPRIKGLYFTSVRVTSSLDNGFVTNSITSKIQITPPWPPIPYLLLYGKLRRFCPLTVDHKLSCSLHKFKMKGEKKFNNYAGPGLYKSHKWFAKTITFCMLTEKVAQDFNLIPIADLITDSEEHIISSKCHPIKKQNPSTLIICNSTAPASHQFQQKEKK